MKFLKLFLGVNLLLSPFSLAMATDLVCVAEVEMIYRKSQVEYRYNSLRIQDFDLSRINSIQTIEFISHKLPEVPYKIISENISVNLGSEVKILETKNLEYSQTIGAYNYFNARDTFAIVKTDGSNVGIESIALDLSSDVYPKTRIFGNQCMMTNRK